jgi:gas vesicle protein
MNNNNNNINFENLSPFEIVDKYEKVITEINMQISNTKELIDQIYKQLIEFKANLSNNNNNSNNNIYSSDIMERINDTQKLFDQLTNELKSLKKKSICINKNTK